MDVYNSSALENNQYNFLKDSDKIKNNFYYRRNKSLENEET